MKPIYFKAEDLKQYIVDFMKHFDVPKTDAEVVADVLVTADLRGIDSHGISRLYSYYGKRLKESLINPQTPTEILSETANSLHIDGGNGLGQVVAERTMSKCIEKAKGAGVAFASVRNSNHFGIAGYYAMMALPENMIGITLTNSQPLVAPTHGMRPMLGTNPIAVAVPAGDEKDFVLDMATSVVPMGKISMHQERNEEIPKEWGMDGNGKPTTNPKILQEGGALNPLGGRGEKMRGYKGYGLSLLVDIFTGILGGASYGPNVGSPLGTGESNVDIGHFFGAMKIELFRSLQEFKADLDTLMKELKQSEKAPEADRIYIHGEKEFEKMKEKSQKGIPILPSVLNSLEKVGEDLGVPFNLEPCHSSNKKG